jgi:hypothetical protein
VTPPSHSAPMTAVVKDRRSTEHVAKPAGSVVGLWRPLNLILEAQV